MSRHRRLRGRWLVRVGPLALVLVIAVGQVGQHPRRLVSMPSAAASPAEVVRAYVGALDAHDFGTAARLLTPAERKRVARTWFPDVDRLTHLEIGTVVPERPQFSGHNRRTQVIDVPAGFDMTYRFRHPDASLPRGHVRWTYRLSRTSDERPWRIFDQGAG
ncbi:MAG: hypothetical protein ABI776_04550 [Nocardioidaceae bacterium]